MKLLCTTFAASLTATTAVAHGGGHLHPHGIDVPFIGLMAAALAIFAFAVLRK